MKPGRIGRTVLILALSASCAAADGWKGGTEVPVVTGPGWDALFNGEDLTGWERVNGTASYRVEDGAIVGVCDPEASANTFLRTRDAYRDFIFTCEVRMEVPGNSGIQFRSQQRDGDGRVYGYQYELDPSPRRWSAGIYGEAWRGWMVNLKERPEAQAAFRPDHWNRVVIHARGDHLRTWMNGVPCAELFDDGLREGFFALQVHVGKRGTILWRDLRVKVLNGEDEVPAAKPGS
ncbi:3-keto-disaccharide hydrolase [Kiritimatiella glycovorans]|uniref:3-keto-alpha-glucoside-1,2-lyase/3-keto-2-hydroxy-glucal hydratase domain-containing protein n=1 Tax=Kiritimatiella glycovorans TaxID=1307763 RepID=A0A0G3EB33_9BACT|nr:DUF1080 domain-containing protein [Kiritimatiella glycovorans]AKJ63503.1 hypothetical protein L21SP4_00219 [Kiritimatiella glycovorans]